MKVEMLSTGDEVLHGEIVDTNAAWLAAAFYQAGYALTFRTTCGDALPTLVETLQQRSKVADILIVNGGLGPTSDDYTAQAAAQAAGVALVRNEQWLTQLQAFFTRRGTPMAAINLKQADIPETAEMLPNGNGTACGFRLELNGCQVFFTPGPPSEFTLMITEQVLPRLYGLFPKTEKLLCFRLTTFGRGESFIADLLADIRLPEGISLGYRAAVPIVEIKLSGHLTQRTAMEACWQSIRQLVGDYLIFEGKSDFASEIALLLNQQGYRLQINEGYSAGLLCWTLARAQAPLCEARLIGLQHTPAPAKRSLEELSADTLSVTVSPLVDNRYLEFALTTAKQHYFFKVEVSEPLMANRQRLQEIVSMQAMYLLHRGLTGQAVQIIYQSFSLVESSVSAR